MKKYFLLLLAAIGFASIPCFAQNNGRPDVFEKTNNTVNKISNAIAIFQPYLLKARQLFYDAKQLAGDVKNSSKAVLGKNGAVTNTGVTGGGYANTSNSGYDTTQHGYAANNSSYNQVNNNNNNGYSNAGNQTGNGYGNGSYQNNNQFDNNNAPQNYLPNQSLPVNNPSSVNNDGSGNWGNQNNGLYGNCLDALTGTVLGMGEASQTPGSVDLLFFAPSDGQNTYTLMTPGFARNNSTATYMTEHTSDQVQQWNDVNETEVALTKLTLGQFNQIQNNSQILNAVRNAQNYAGYYSSVGQKLDGCVFAIKAQMENRQVYALIAIIKQIGTSGSNGYLKIKIKAQGINSNGNGYPDAANYLR